MTLRDIDNSYLREDAILSAYQDIGAKMIHIYTSHMYKICYLYEDENIMKEDYKQLIICLNNLQIK